VDRVFLDANVLFSAAYRDHSALVRLWDMPDAAPVTSQYAIEEARRNLDQVDQHSRLAKLTGRLEIIPDEDVMGEEIVGVDLPAKDWPILWAAIVAKATHLLTGDVRHFGPYFGRPIAGVRIMQPADYFREKDNRTSRA
jgi:predicted nucleic acid-binding protein